MTTIEISLMVATLTLLCWAVLIATRDDDRLPPSVWPLQSLATLFAIGLIYLMVTR